MSFNFTIPTWASIRDMFLLIVIYYGTWVAPQYDWWIFAATYYLGFLVALRTWYRYEKPYPYCDCTSMSTCNKCAFKQWLFAYAFIWPLMPLFKLSGFIVSSGNKTTISDRRGL